MEQGPGGGTHPRSIRSTHLRHCRVSARNLSTFILREPSVSTRDWREDYARRGGFYGITFHDYADTDSQFGFERIQYEAIQHIPVLREAWVIILRGRVETTSLKDDQQLPFFMLPSLGSGSTLRAYPSWRFRDRNSLLLQAEWRVMVNRMLDLALFYDTGKVTAEASDLSSRRAQERLRRRRSIPRAEDDPASPRVRAGSEGFNIVFGSSSAF